MKEIIKIILLINLFFFIVPINILTAELIIPQKKPTISQNTKDLKASNYLVPKKKPIANSQKVISDELIVEKKVKKVVDGVILPKSKPLIVKKNVIIAKKKSKYFSEKDFKIASQSIKLMEKRNWFEAERIAKKAKNKSIYNFIQWKHLITTGNTATFFDYKSFIDRNDSYPRMGRVKYLSEHKLSTKIMSPKKIIEYFESEMPLSGFGEIVLGESYIATGEIKKGMDLIKKGWVTADLSKSEIKMFRKKYKKYLSEEDFVKRADYLAWENKYWDLKRILIYLPKDQQLLYTARQLLMSKS